MSQQTNLNVGLVFQEYNLFPQYTAQQNITLTLTKVLRLKQSEADEIAIDLLRKMDLMKKRNVL